MNLGHLFMSGQFSLFVSKYSPGTEFVVPSPLWLLLLVPGLDWNGAIFLGTLLLEHFWSLKPARGKIQNYANMVAKFKVQSCTNVYFTFIICVLKFATKICNKS